MFERVAVYAVAHQDDWQLFMDPDISADLLDPACKTVVIHTTAGDAGHGRAFWHAREEGAISSLLFRISGQSVSSVIRKQVTVGNRQIPVAEAGNGILYFLRLPDGGGQGDGFGGYRYQSLSKMRLDLIDLIASVDGENTFRTFGEISGLVNAILLRELQVTGIADPGKMTLNFPEFDHALNPNDHSDHLNTALLLQQMALYPSVRKRAFVHYHTQHSAGDLCGTDLFWKVGMFCVYHQTIRSLHGYSTIDESPQYQVWCKKESLRRKIL